MISGVTIFPMTEADLAFATKCTDIERWGYLPDDFRRLMLFQPGGCFVARSKGRRTGIVTTTGYGRYAFIGSLIVLKSYRGAGVGELLMRRAIEFLEAKGVKTIELDGVFEAASLYRRLGFVDKYHSQRFHRPPHKTAGRSPSVRVPSLNKLLTYDKNRTSISRGHILEHYYRLSDRSYLVAGAKAISGYVLVRPGAGDRVSVGPMVADDLKSCRTLMSAVLARYGHISIGMGVPEGNREMVDLVRSLDFMSLAPSMRMYRGRRKNYEKYIRSILSPEKG